LPSKDAFYSRLKGEGITGEDYKHAREVWDEFEMKTFRKYQELYNRTDVLLLADVEEFLLRLRCSPLYINMDFGLESMGGNGVSKMSA